VLANSRSSGSLFRFKMSPFVGAHDVAILGKQSTRATLKTMSVKRTIKRRVMFAEIHQDTRGDEVHKFSIKYRKVDGEIGYKANVSKSIRNLPGKGKYNGNVKINHVLLLYDYDTDRTFEILIDLMIEYNGLLIDHTV
jgi:hypothetical protein